MRNLMPFFGRPAPSGDFCREDRISRECRELKNAKTRGELGAGISRLVLAHSPADIQRMKHNFETKVQDLSYDYRTQLTKKISEHLLGTFQRIRLAKQEGTFRAMNTPVNVNQAPYWDMVSGQCCPDTGQDGPAIRFLKYLLAGYCMLVLNEPGHAVGTPFPGGDQVEFIEGIYYCPVREKANDVDAALCPFCPARQTPEIGYLRPPTTPSESRKQEFIDNCYRYHNFNG